MKYSIYVTVLLVHFVTCTATNESTSTPPSFKHKPNPWLLYYVTSEQVLSNPNHMWENLKELTLACEADGYPKPNCHWLKDKTFLDIEKSNGRITQKQGSGTITMSHMQKTDEGEYQCVCENDAGTALEHTIELKNAFIENFLVKNFDIVEVELSKPFEKHCNSPRSVPPAKIFWIQSRPLRNYKNISSDHIVMKDNGSIYFQYVRVEDDLEGFNYTCIAKNMILDEYKIGDEFQIRVIWRFGEQFPDFIPPREQFVSEHEVTVLKGDSFELFCVFSGYPDIIPKWRKMDWNENGRDGVLDWDRVTLGTNFNKSLKINNARFEDDGDYECIFDQDQGLSVRREFRVFVQAVPWWLAPPPLDANITDKNTYSIEFYLPSAGRPHPAFTFYKNGREFKSDNWRITVAGSKMKIENLKKSDTAVYQHKVENKYGYLWTNFYLNVQFERSAAVTDKMNLINMYCILCIFTCQFNLLYFWTDY